ncbi:MAG: hypothetical protein HY898_35445 [Deltaproteobacteria bacterium]|nr:hypothetical protein [Deltaproteobacteria bacterium]
MNRSFCKLLLLGSIALCGIVACAATRVSLAGGTREYVAADYDTVLRKWTRTEHLIAISELDDLLTVTATYESYDFRWAYVVRYAQDYRLTVEQRSRLLETALAETRTSHQFYVALYGANVRWTDLSRPSTAWIVRLTDDLGTETAPEQIVSIRKPGPIERTYYPYTSVWRQAFRLRFPVTAGGRPTISPQAQRFGLRFAGAQGNQELHWDLETATAATH